jgi:hypothetical protein
VALDNAKMTATMIANWVGGYRGAAPGRSYAESKPVRTFGRGE